MNVNLVSVQTGRIIWCSNINLSHAKDVPGIVTIVESWKSWLLSFKSMLAVLTNTGTKCRECTALLNIVSVLFFKNDYRLKWPAYSVKFVIGVSHNYLFLHIFFFQFCLTSLWKECGYRYCSHWVLTRKVFYNHLLTSTFLLG